MKRNCFNYSNVFLPFFISIEKFYSQRRTSTSPAPGAYENFADNDAYAVVKVSGNHDVTYENVIDPTLIDEEYEPIESPKKAAEEVDISYENVDQARYENIDQTEKLGQSTYENLEQPSYENVDEEMAANDAIDVDPAETYENVVLREPVKAKPLEIVHVYEDVIPPPPPKTTDSEEVIYHQVKVLRQSIQEVNQLLREDPTVLQIAIADLGDYPVRNTAPSPVKIRTSPLKELTSDLTVEQDERKESSQTSTKKEAMAKDSCVKDLKLSPLVIKDIVVEQNEPKLAPPKGVRLSLSPKRVSTVEEPVQSEPKTEVNRNGKDQPHLPLSVSLPSLLNSNRNQNKSSSTTTTTSPPAKNISLPPTPVYDLRAESDSVSSKRRFESEIGRDLLRERRIRNEIEHSRRSESNLLQTSGQQMSISPIRRQSTSESSTLIKAIGKPALPVKMNAKKSQMTTESKPVISPKRSDLSTRPTTLETSFDYEPRTPVQQRRASSPPSSGSPLSPVSPTSEGRNFTPSGARKTSVKELLNKFQTGGDNNENKSSQRVASTPTSPVKATSPVSSANKSLTSESESIKKMNNTEDGKENIEVHLSPTPKSNSETCEMTVEMSDSCQTGEMMMMTEQDAKDLLRHKPLSVGIDMSDPRTRLRIERYKEERRSFLREKYKSESFRSDSKEDAVIVRLKQKAGSPTHQSAETFGSDETSSPPPPVAPPSLQTPEPGLIDEDVNVKERAAQWAQTLPSLAATSPIKTAPLPTHRSCSEAVTIAPQHHKRIRDMAALFEKETP